MLTPKGTHMCSITPATRHHIVAVQKYVGKRIWRYIHIHAKLSQFVRISRITLKVRDESHIEWQQCDRLAQS